MEAKLPRVLIAGTGSGCGKTSVSCAILQAFVNRGVNVGALKCGPDYIDPMFHSRIIGAKSANLDLHFFDENTLRYLLFKNAQTRDVSIIEGVMGYYDGDSLTGTRTSSYEVSKVAETPTVLVLDAAGAALSVLATIQGFLSFCPDHRIQGVILNRCSPMSYGALKTAIEARFPIRAYGFLPKMQDCRLESRHLGLVTAAEVENLREKLQTLAQQAEKSIDLDGLLALAQQAPAVSFQPIRLPERERVRIAVAQDKAFCFYYEDNFAAIREMGGQIVPFSPLEDSALPENIQGLYLGGGYPELYAQKLSENKSMLASVKEALKDGLPCIAECGGFMYLTQAIGEYPMVGALEGRCFDTGHLTRFGYVTLQAQKDNLLCRAGGKIAAHEFHHWDCTDSGADFTAVKPSGRSWQCAVATARLYAGFPHFHFYANPEFLTIFYDACVKEKHRDDRKNSSDGH